jgi:hypothetical protein
MFTRPFLCELGQQWWCPSKFRKYPFVIKCGKGKGGKPPSECVPFSKTIVVIIFEVYRGLLYNSLPQGHQSKWVPRSSMVWPHQCYERWETVGCGEPKRVHSVVKKWVENKWNAGVIGWVNKQAPTLGLAHEWKHACMITKGVSTKSEANFYSCK